MSALFPPGVTHLADMPHTWFDALRMALSWLTLDELPEDERPPRSIWLESDLMAEHWKKVKVMRDRKYGGKSNDSMDGWDIDGPASDNDMMRDLGVK